MARLFQSFTWKEANFRICSSRVNTAVREIKEQRKILEEYIAGYPEFSTALSPIECAPEAPEIACRMHAASQATGVGPMAAVAGTMAQMAAEAVLREVEQEGHPHPEEIIVENGGDLYFVSDEMVVVGLYAGAHSLSGKIAFAVEPQQTPLAICSSSSHMGHSLSFGSCDLATVLSKSASLADAAATLAGNLVKEPGDVDRVMDRIMSIPGILGILVVKEERVGLAGELPELIRHDDSAFSDKITVAAGVPQPPVPTS